MHACTHTHTHACTHTPFFIVTSHCSIPNISENKAREALLRECRNHCCYGKGAAESLTFDNITSTSAFHVSWGGGGGVGLLKFSVIVTFFISFVQYQLETFTEGRNTAWAYEPYNGK